MSTSSNSSLAKLASKPFDLLLAMEQLAHSAEVKTQKTQTEWVGVGVLIDGAHYLIPQAQVLEVLKKPETTRVPGSRRWMLGLANVRGMLFPVVDVQLYCGDKPTEIGRDSRIVLINIEAAPVAIVVDEVFGFRRFPAKMTMAPGAASPLGDYVLGTFAQDDTSWSVIDVIKLINAGGVVSAA
ncbi:MAG: chemotaxis protein CheW [Gammaproteobacteria bacterium]